MAYFTFIAFPCLSEDEVDDLKRYGKFFAVQHSEHDCAKLEHQHCLINASSIEDAFEKMSCLLSTKHTAPRYVRRVDEWLFGLSAATTNSGVD